MRSQCKLNDTENKLKLVNQLVEQNNMFKTGKPIIRFITLDTERF